MQIKTMQSSDQLEMLECRTINDVDGWIHPITTIQDGKNAGGFKGVYQGYEPYTGASDNPIPVDVLRITQDPITEKDG